MMMAERAERPVGLTKDTGYQIGARRTLPVDLDAAWRLVTSAEGIKVWLGEPVKLVFTAGDAYVLEDGSKGEIRVFKPGSHLRMTWHPPGWPRPSTIQVRVVASGEKTVIAFHQEHLPDEQAREARRAHFIAALDALEQILSAR
jgi:uncharacterized protein YndB with AHSA1/START domain